MLRWICVIMLLLVVAAVVAEQYVVRTGRTVTGKPVVRVACASWQMGEMPFEPFIEAYRQTHPEVEVELAILPDDSNNKLVMLWQHDQTPYDVLIAYADEEIHTFIRQGLLADVSDYLTPEQMATFVPASMAGSTVVGSDGRPRRYMVPFTIEMMTLNVQAHLLRQRGHTTPPATWDELRRMAVDCKGFESAGRTVWPMACDFGQGFFFGQNYYIPLLAAFTEGQIADADGRLVITGPEAERAFAEAKQWYLDGLVSESAKVFEQADRDFMAGLAVIYPHWQSRSAYAQLEFPDAEFVPWPVPGSDVAGSLVSCYGAIVPKASRVKEQAVQFAYECLSQWIQPAVAVTGKMPPVSNVYEYGFDKSPAWLQKLQERFARSKPEWLEAVEKVYAQAKLPQWMIDLRPALEKGYSFPDKLMWPKVNHELAIEFQRYLDGIHATPADALAALKKSVDAMYERRRERGM